MPRWLQISRIRNFILNSSPTCSNTPPWGEGCPAVPSLCGFGAGALQNRATGWGNGLCWGSCPFVLNNPDFTGLEGKRWPWLLLAGQAGPWLRGELVLVISSAYGIWKKNSILPHRFMFVLGLSWQMLLQKDNWVRLPGCFAQKSQEKALDRYI